MQLNHEWNLLAVRIQALLDIDLGVDMANHVGHVVELLQPEVHALLAELRKFSVQFATTLPGRGQEILEAALKQAALQLDTVVKTTDKNSKKAPWYKLRATLHMLRAQMEFELDSGQEFKLRLTERAFLHTQRMIVVSPNAQKDWAAAWKKNEESCEKLGAAYLLAHGIWSFKVNSEGARTDLINAETPLS
jgi:hypothetical protein